MSYEDTQKLVEILNDNIEKIDKQLEFTGIEDYGDILDCKIQEKMIELRDMLLEE